MDDPTAFNDSEIVTDRALVEVLEQDGMDSMLAQHVGMLFSRDPVVVLRRGLIWTIQNRTNISRI